MQSQIKLRVLCYCVLQCFSVSIANGDGVGVYGDFVSAYKIYLAQCNYIRPVYLHKFTSVQLCFKPFQVLFIFSYRLKIIIEL